MCSSDTMQKLTQTVKQFLDEGRMFTGYDVTIETRQREHMQLRHQEVRQDIHEIQLLRDALGFGHEQPDGTVVSWSQTRRDMPGGGWAYVFHPINLDPNNYQPQQNIYSAPLASDSNIASISSVVPSTVPSKGNFEVDSRGRLLIPTRFMRAAGFNAGDVAYMCPYFDDKKVILTKDTNLFFGLTVMMKRVERDGDIRLSPILLNASDLRGVKEFSIQNSEQDSKGAKVKVVEIQVA